MKKVILTLGITLAIIIAAIVIYVYSGAYNVSQLAPDNSLVSGS